MKTLTFIAALLPWVISASCTAQTTAAPTSQPTQTPITKLTLHPSPAAGSWPTYRLIPSVLDQEPGNAVPFYLMSRQFWPDQKTTNEVLLPENHRYDYLTTPIDQFPEQYARKLLDAYATTLTYAETGARRRDADWEQVWDINPSRPDLIGQGRFSYIDNLRHVENLLSFRARFEISKHDYPAALHTVQNMLSIARHTGSENVLIHRLVEAGFVELSLVVPLEEWIGRPGSPNLYWPLSNLPRPFVTNNMRGYYDDPAALKWQPLLVQAMQGTLPPNKWPEALRDIVVRGLESRPSYKADPAKIDEELQRLIGNSTATEVGQRLIREYKNAADPLWQASGLPFPQATREMLRVWQQINPHQPPASNNPLIQADLVSTYDTYPAPLRLRYQFERVDRYVALLRVIEELRDYAAHHDGQPPARLEDVTSLPVPIDPMTGRPFAYDVKGNVAVLDATPPNPFSVFGGWRYELTFAK